VVRTVWIGTSPLWRGAAILAAIGIAGTAWYLGSPLFIRTTLNEELPGATAAPAATAATAAATGAAQATSAAQTAAAGVTILAQGELQFVDSVHNGKGPVRLVQVGTQKLVRFENVEITNAPDVHVYLSRESGGKWAESTSLYLGALKATNGSFNYEIPAGMDVAPYKSVVVWCRAFAVLITWADLKPA
jgi:hypothetical protein